MRAVRYFAAASITLKRKPAAMISRMPARTWRSPFAPSPRPSPPFRGRGSSCGFIAASMVTSAHAQALPCQGVDGALHLGVLGQEAGEIAGEEGEQAAITERANVGRPRTAGDQRDLAEEIAAAEPHLAARDIDGNRAGGDEIHGVAPLALGDDALA